MLIRATARQYCQEKLAPRIIEANRHELVERIPLQRRFGAPLLGGLALEPVDLRQVGRHDRALVEHHAARERAKEQRVEPRLVGRGVDSDQLRHVVGERLPDAHVAAVGHDAVGVLLIVVVVPDVRVTKY